jgi:hypothetical protein
MLISFNHDELKSYLKKRTGFVIKSIYSIDDNNMWFDTQFEFDDNQIIVISSICDADKTAGYRKFGFSDFLWNNSIFISDYIKFIRKRKIKQINKIRG